MKRVLIAAAAACLAAGLSACGTAGLKPDEARQLLADFHKAGCGGRVDLDAGAASGQLGGAAHVQLGLHGECPVGDVVPAASGVKAGDALPAAAAP